MDVSASFRSGRYNYVSGAKGFDWLALKLDLFAEEYRTGAVGSGSNPPPVTIHTWLERFNKQKPRSFEKAVAPVDAENWISHIEIDLRRDGLIMLL
ncbi:hypothetical protein Tco_1262533 [Tanacetum coccineum]